MSTSFTPLGREFLVWCPERGMEREDAHRVLAHSAEGAARKWGEWDDARSADYSIARGNPTTVRVCDAAAPEAEGASFVVRAELRPLYTAERA